MNKIKINNKIFYIKEILYIKMKNNNNIMKYKKKVIFLYNKIIRIIKNNNLYY